MQQTKNAEERPNYQEVSDREKSDYPFDKRIGICIMKVSTYNNKVSETTNLPQCEKLTETRRSGKHPIRKEEERITSCLLYTSPSPRDGLLSRMPSSA